MFGLGMPELVIILVLVVIVFGTGKLTNIGRDLGQAISEFKTSLSPEAKEKKELSEDKPADAAPHSEEAARTDAASGAPGEPTEHEHVKS